MIYTIYNIFDIHYLMCIVYRLWLMFFGECHQSRPTNAKITAASPHVPDGTCHQGIIIYHIS